MDESDGLENRCGRKVTVGSNPTSSAVVEHTTPHLFRGQISAQLREAQSSLFRTFQRLTAQRTSRPVGLG